MTRLRQGMSDGYDQRLEAGMMDSVRKEGADPLARMMEKVAEARDWRDASFLEWAEGDDPLASLEQKVAMAREDSRTQGQRSLDALEDRIRAATRLPEPRDYTRPDNPMEHLMERVRGEAPEDSARDERGRESEAVSSGREEPAREREEVMGRQLLASLEGRALEGAARAKAAALVAEMMEDREGDKRLGRLWDLIVFGKS